MKHHILLALGALLLATPAAADTTTRSNVRGLAASAAWYQVDACVEAGVSLWAFDQADRSTQGQPVYTQEVLASVSYFDYCTGRSFEAFGDTVTVLEFDGLDSAVVEIPVTMTWSSDGVLESATLTAAFTATGDEVSEKSSSFFENASLRVKDRYSATHRWCDVSGSLVLGGAELAGNLMDAELFDIRQGRHLVTRD